MRILWTIFVLGAWGGLSIFFHNTGMLISGESSVMQLQNSDVAFLASQQGMHLGQVVSGLAPFIILVILIAIWYKPVARLFTQPKQ